jgi:flavin reductase (DIM6/NTAB) family NADH-FMN oxidoreductase RutF
MKRSIIISVIIILSGITHAQTGQDTLKGFKKITFTEFNEDAVKLIGDQWMLVTAGNYTNKFNMMTANWGGLGWLWNKPVAYIFVRPQRYTYEFIEKETFFTLTFFDIKYKDILLLLGSKSGREIDKMNNSGLTPIETANKSIAFTEARIVLECKKIYGTKIKTEDFIDKDIDKQVYPKKDYHKMYIGEIVNIWVQYPPVKQKQK